MKLSLYRNDGKTETLRTIELDKLMDSLRKETSQKPITTFRQKLRGYHPEAHKMDPSLLPVMLFTTTFRRDEKRISMTGYNGIVLLEVNHLASPEEVISVRELAAEIPQTLAAFTGSSGRSVKILIPFMRPDQSLPVSQEDARIYQAHAYIKAVRIYQPQIPFPIDFKEPLLDRGCRYTYDPYLYYNPGAHPVLMKQPDQMPVDVKLPELTPNLPNPVERLLPGYDRFKTVSLLYETSLASVREKISFSDKEDIKVRKSFFCELSRACFLSGIPEEDAVHFTNFHFSEYNCEWEIRETFHNCYSLMSGFGDKPCIGKEQLLSVRLDEFMKRRYEFRYNTQAMQVEYRRNRSACFYFNPVDERVLNSISMDALSEGLNVWDRDIRRYIHSDRIPVYSPLENFFYYLPGWDGVDRIRELAGMVSCNNPLWPEFFFCWFLGMVAQWQGRNKLYGNSLSPLLVGAQGTGKSTFCRNLLPPELRSLYTDRVDFTRKRDAELSLHRFALINIDEFDQISVKDQAFLKHILSKPEVTLRAPYRKGFDVLRRHASFIATSNHKELLSDTTGSRRFIAIEVKDRIDNSIYIDYSQLYAQAQTLLRKGISWWLTPEQEALLTESNEEFRIVPPVEQLFMSYFRIPESGEEGKWLMAVEILTIIKQKSGLPLSEYKIVQFGRIIKKQGITSKRIEKGTVYYVTERLS